ncbi:transglycosylase SLT domain-containing protein [Microbacterium resistens]|uniref:aggregation-promoting factor C-terminal-like domain-containing protein n=1 Tax=Microbacterium resistens TaxID=156977 RepID=UPI00286BDA28|nr:transglycosylase SLT domain-containing protein [Microbacterium resistens]
MVSTAAARADAVKDTARSSRSASGASHWTRRRGFSAIFAGVAVVGFSAAILAPAGLAMATPAPVAAAQTTYSLAAKDAQNITVTVQGAQATPMSRDGFEVYVTPTPTPTPTPTQAPAPASTGEDSSGESSGGGSGPVQYTGGGDSSTWLAAAGIDPADWGYVDYIVSRESGWNPNAVNSGSGASGLVQALPCSKVPGNCFDPVDNLRWANGYAVGRYGSWAAAQSFWSNNHWW